MHRGLSSTTLSQLAFPGKKQSEFPSGEIPMGQYSVTKTKKISFLIEHVILRNTEITDPQPLSKTPIPHRIQSSSESLKALPRNMSLMKKPPNRPLGSLISFSSTAIKPSHQTGAEDALARRHKVVASPHFRTRSVYLIWDLPTCN